MQLPEEARPKFKGNKISFLHQLDFPIQCLISYFGALLLLVLNSAGSEVKNACHPQICLSEGKFLRRKKHILAYWVDSITDTFQWVQILETTHFNSVLGREYHWRLEQNWRVVTLTPWFDDFAAAVVILPNRPNKWNIKNHLNFYELSIYLSWSMWLKC